MLAAEHGCVKVVKVLIKAGADVNLKDKVSYRSQQCACISIRFDCNRMKRLP